MTQSNKAIIFDLGGVMVDWNPTLIAQNFSTDKILQQAIIEELFEHSRWIDFDQGNISEKNIVQQASHELKLSIMQTESLIKQAKQSLHVKQCSVALLKKAKRIGLTTLCLSNVSYEWFDFLYNKHEFFKLFDGKVISAEEGISKPNPDIYRRIIKRYKIDTQHTLFIDDNLDNTQIAKNLGIQAITFDGSQQQLNAISEFISG